MFGKTEDLIIILLIILLLFGAKKIPDLARSIGQSAREIRKGFTGDDSPQAKKEQPEKTEKEAASDSKTSDSKNQSAS